MLNLVKKQQTLYGLEGYNTIIENVIKELNAQNYYFDIKLILTEALSNAFEHGNHGDKSKPINLSYNFDGECLNFRITHSNIQRQNISIPICISDEKLLDEHGRGLFLIQSMVDKVEFNGNSLIITKLITDDKT